MVGSWENFCLKVKNTFLEVGGGEDPEGEDQWKRSESQPDWTTKKLLGSSFNFSKLQDGKQSPKSGASFEWDRDDGRPPEIEEICEPEWEPEAELPGMLRQVTADADWPTWEGRQESQSSSSTAVVLTAEKPTADVSADETAPTATGEGEAPVQKRTRRRRKRDSLIDKAAKQNREPVPGANSGKSAPQTGKGVAQDSVPSTRSSTRGTKVSSSCPHCAGQVQPGFKFCYYCGKTLANPA